MKACEPAVTTVLHPVIITSDMERSLHFYRTLLGLVVSNDEVHDRAAIGQLTGYHDPDVRAVALKAPDGTEIEIGEFRSPPTRPAAHNEWRDAGLRSITFLTADLDALVSALKNSNVRFLSDVVAQPQASGVVAHVVYCLDPDGVIVTLAQLPAQQRGPAAD